MVSAGYASVRPQNHYHCQPSAPLQQSQTQYLKEAFGLQPSTPPTQNQPSNESEWPSLNNSMFSDPHDRCASQQRGMMARRTNPMQVNQQLNRRPTSIGRVNPQDAARNINAVQQQMSALQLQKQAQQQAINNANNNGGAPKNPKLYKTELCRSWADCGRCNYGDRCQYAHGDSEKRPIPRHPKYKTESCQSYHQSGYCAYGARCHFIHNEEAHVLAQMVAANAASKQPIGQSPIRPSNLFTNVAAAGVSSPTIGSPQRGTPVNMGPIGSVSAASNPTAIARVASLAASAYNQNPNFFSHQFQTQLQIFNEGLKTPNEGSVTPTQQSSIMGSTGESPIPSSNDSGTESPVACSFSPGSELDDPNFFFVRKEKNAVPKLQNAPLNLLPSSLSSDVESGFVSSSSSTSSNVGTKSLNSPIVGSPPHLATTPSANTMWSPGVIGTPTSAGRLPVFERLSNGP